MYDIKHIIACITQVKSTFTNTNPEYKKMPSQCNTCLPVQKLFKMILAQIFVTFAHTSGAYLSILFSLFLAFPKIRIKSQVNRGKCHRITDTKSHTPSMEITLLFECWVEELLFVKHTMYIRGKHLTLFGHLQQIM